MDRTPHKCNKTDKSGKDQISEHSEWLEITESGKLNVIPGIAADFVLDIALRL